MNLATRLRLQRALALALLLTILFSAGCARRPRTTPQSSTPKVNQVSVLMGRVVGIADGDTISLLDSINTHYRIRLQGIDAPESHQDFGTQSKKNLSDMIFNKQVTAMCDKTDRYGRLVCKIVFEGTDINLEQVKAGMAWHYKDYASEQEPNDRELYARAEEAARKARRGLWIDANAIEPAEFRRDEREGDEDGARR